MRADWPQGAWERGVGTLPAVGPAGRKDGRRAGAGHVGGLAVDTARWASNGYILLGRHLVFCLCS